jgi:ribonuclease PH
MESQQRPNGRLSHQLRPVTIVPDILSYAASSLIFEMGLTKILCAVTLQQGVPPFLRGKKSGWLNAEYAMLPAATQTRTPREITQMKRSGRSIEISRLISRTLRTIVNLDVLGEQTIFIDCDVLQADGGTRVACITAASFALALAQVRWLEQGAIACPFLTDSLVAISVGICNDQVVLDPDYQEDSTLHADFNLVITGSNKLVEIQGGAERQPISWHLFDAVRAIALAGAATLQNQMYKELEKLGISTTQQVADAPVKRERAVSTLFSLKNRLTART